MKTLLYIAILFLFYSCSTNPPEGDKEKTVEIQLVWEDSLNNRQVCSYPPHYSDGMVYILAGDGIYAYNAKNGERIWQIEGDNNFWIPDGRIFSDDTRLYVTLQYNAKRDLYCLNKKTGEIIFQSHNSVERVNIVDDKFVYVIDHDGALKALDKYDGTEQWKHYPPGGTPGRLWDHPTVVDDTLYLAVGGYNTQNAQGYLVKLDKNDGSLIYQVETKLPDDSTIVHGPSAPPVLYKNLVIIENSDLRVYAFERKTGQIVWTYYHGGAINFEPIVINGVVYYATQDTRVFALNAENGEEIWKSNETKGSCTDGPPAIYDDFIFISSSDSYIHCFDKNTGEHKLKIKNHWAPVADNNYLYAGGYYTTYGWNGNIKAYKININER